VLSQRKGRPVEDANQDYINDTKKLTASLPFVVGELALLRPAVVMVAKPLWTDAIFQAAMRGASPRSRFLPVPQFNARVVNCTLGKCDRVAEQLRKRLANAPIDHWMGQLKRVNQNNAWRYIAMVMSWLPAHLPRENQQGNDHCNGRTSDRRVMGQHG